MLHPSDRLPVRESWAPGNQWPWDSRSGCRSLLPYHDCQSVSQRELSAGLTKCSTRATFHKRELSVRSSTYYPLPHTDRKPLLRGKCARTEPSDCLGSDCLPRPCTRRLRKDTWTS